MLRHALRELHKQNQPASGASVQQRAWATEDVDFEAQVTDTITYWNTAGYASLEAAIAELIANLKDEISHAKLEAEIEALTEFWSGYEFEESKTCCEKERFNILFHLLRFILYIAPFAVALQDTGDLTMSLKASDRASLAWEISGGATAFFTSLGLNGKETFKDFETFLFYLRRWKVPEEQKYGLSTQREIAAFLLSAIPIFWSTITDTLNAWYFISHLKIPIPYWRYASIPLTPLIGINTLCTEGNETLNFFRQTLKPKPYEEESRSDFCKMTREFIQKLKTVAQHPRLKYSQFLDEFIHDKRLFASHVLSNLIGVPLGMLSCFQDIVNISYILQQTLLYCAGLDEVEYLWIVSGLSLISGITEYLFHGRYAKLAIKDAIYALLTLDLNVKKIIASAGSLATAGFLAYLHIQLNILFYNGLLKGYEFESNATSDEIFKYLSYMVALQQMILGAATIHPGFYNLLTCIEKIIQGLKSKCYKKDAAPIDQSASDSLLSNETDVEQAQCDEDKAKGESQPAGQHHRFFAPKASATNTPTLKFPSEAKPKSSFKHRCGCTVS